MADGWIYVETLKKKFQKMCKIRWVCRSVQNSLITVSFQNLNFDNSEELPSTVLPIKKSLYFQKVPHSKYGMENWAKLSPCCTMNIASIGRKVGRPYMNTIRSNVTVPVDWTINEQKCLDDRTWLIEPLN